jgi:hypothetical protein
MFATGLYLPPVLRKGPPPVPPQTIICVPVHTAVWRERPVGAPKADIGVQASVSGSYRPPVFVYDVPSLPPQTTTRLPVQTPLTPERAVGAPVVVVGLQVSVAGS